MKTNFSFLLAFCWLLLALPLSGQQVSSTEIRQRVQQYKKDWRGPYRDIRWFCPDGSVVPPSERCSQRGGIQHARTKVEVDELAASNGIYLGQILAGQNKADFWDEGHYFSRLKQYMMGKYLEAVDDGWIMRKAQFYRGAIQAEDESKWGMEFFQHLLRQKDILQEQFFLVRQALRDIPHTEDDPTTVKVRALSMNIADEYEAFMPLRIKIHGHPEPEDVDAVRNFRTRHKSALSRGQLADMDELIVLMDKMFVPANLQNLKVYVGQLESQPVRLQLTTMLEATAGASGRVKLAAVAELLYAIRLWLPEESSTIGRLAMMDMSRRLEEIMFREISSWEATTLSQILDKIYHLGLAATGAGYMEIWEWEMVSRRVPMLAQGEIGIRQLLEVRDLSRRLVEWSAGMVRAHFQPTVDLYGEFEPLAFGFIDDRIRSSVVLPMGMEVARLGDFVAEQAGFSNQVLGIPGSSRVRGLNPGYAKGELVIVEGNPEHLEVSADKIYAFQVPPSDLKPVAGILSVSEGNMVSHVQLLARNLGIPNAVVSDKNVQDLKAYAGKEVFYAISLSGTVNLKLASQMTAEEKKLFEVSARSEERVRVPVEKLVLDNPHIINMRQVRSKDSGKLCGPKAANLGQLKSMFPENVVEGFVIPFAIFREHLNQAMPGHAVSYWEFLNETFRQATIQEQSGAPAESVEAYVLGRLATLRAAIQQIQLSAGFLSELRAAFREILGDEIGKVPVFLRSDTNMEDLKDFTGAGLNKTIFNTVSETDIIEGIKTVWASPFTERSYKWRQKYLLNPENVFPSILVIPSVDVDYSGVMITKGIVSNSMIDNTVAFSRGAGGAVDGQAAESYLLTGGGDNVLLSPAREPWYRRLPATGGSTMKLTAYDEPILNSKNLRHLRQLASRIRKILPNAPGVETKGPFDVELGFKDDKIWLFQVRPFVESKQAASSDYLLSITPQVREDILIPLSSEL